MQLKIRSTMPWLIFALDGPGRCVRIDVSCWLFQITHDRSIAAVTGDGEIEPPAGHIFMKPRIIHGLASRFMGETATCTQFEIFETDLLK
jgi:hypothetical protein